MILYSSTLHERIVDFCSWTNRTKRGIQNENDECKEVITALNLYRLLSISVV